MEEMSKQLEDENYKVVEMREEVKEVIDSIISSNRVFIFNMAENGVPAKPCEFIDELRKNWDYFPMR